MAAASLHALLARSIDYAGMFRPCSLALGPALKNQAQYVRSPDSWVLSAFVLPIAKFDAASAGHFGARTENGKCQRFQIGFEDDDGNDPVVCDSPWRYRFHQPT